MSHVGTEEATFKPSGRSFPVDGGVRHRKQHCEADVMISALRRLKSATNISYTLLAAFIRPT